MPEYKKVDWNETSRKGYEVSVAPSGNTYYLLDGKLHREDGPAIIYSDGIKEWYLNGKEIYKKDFTIEMILKMNASELFTPQELAKLRLDKSV